MATIGKIRKHSGLVVGAIGVAIFAFVISDAFQSNSMLFSKNQDMLGEVAGEKIDYRDFHYRYEEAVEIYKQNNQLQNMDETQRSEVRQQVWNEIVEEIIYNNEYEKIHLNITKSEAFEKIAGPDPHQAVRSFFTNPETGVFDRNMLAQFLKNLDQQKPEYQQIWFKFEEGLQKEIIRQKYFNLIKNSFYITALEAREDYYAKNKFAAFDYVMLPLRSIPDTIVEYTEKQVLAYYKKHAKEYEVEEGRSFEYVVFDILPTQSDSQELFRQMQNIKEEFRQTKRDSLYVNVHSEVPFDTQYHTRDHFTEIIDEVFFDAEIDSVIGPFEERGKIKLAKLIDRKEDTLSYYKASHILIKPENASDEDTANAMKTARELLKEIKNEEDFSNMARRKSDDKGSAIKGGDLGWFADGTMVKPFMDAVKTMKKGDFKVVKSQFGAHIIYCTENSSNKVIKVGVIEKSIEPGTNTVNKAYDEVKKFRTAIRNKEDFDNVVLEMKLAKRMADDIRPEESDLPGFHQARRLVGWAYNAKLNEISDILEFDDKFVVAVLTKIVEKGVAPLEHIRDQIEQKVILENKKEMLYEKFQEANASASTLEEIAQALNVRVEKASNLSFDVTMISGIGDEKYLAGAVIGSKEGQISKPLKGENAVFQYQVSRFSEVQEPEDLSGNRNQLLSNMQGMSQYQTMETLNKKADIKDYKYKFY
jgi:peptidyl-prolyl cis-trans isomerase D